MQPERIAIIPPTHEQSLFSFHVEQDLANSFLLHLKAQGLTPWRPPIVQEKEGPHGFGVTQIEVDTKRSQKDLEEMVAGFLREQPGS